MGALWPHDFSEPDCAGEFILEYNGDHYSLISVKGRVRDALV